MRHRIEALHGHFALRSNPGHGTQIDVEVPRAAAQSAAAQIA
jgi:signal transduction histidine kinase